MACAEAVAARIGGGVPALCNVRARTAGVAAARQAYRTFAAASGRRSWQIDDRGRRRTWSGKNSGDQDLARPFEERGCGRQARRSRCAFRITDPRHSVARWRCGDRSSEGTTDRTRTRDTADRARRNGRETVAANPAVRLSRLGRDRCVDPVGLIGRPRFGFVPLQSLLRHPGLVPASSAPQTVSLDFVEPWMPERARHDEGIADS